MTNKVFERGFSLLEVLVAFVILSISLGIILQIFSVSGRITNKATIEQQAILIAENKMAELLSQPELEPGNETSFIQRSSVRFRSSMNIAPVQFPNEGTTSVTTALIPYEITVSVSLEGAVTPEITLKTIRLVHNL